MNSLISKRNFFLFTASLCLSFGLTAQVKVGNNSTPADPSAALEVESTTKGMLPPRMSTNERDAIQNPSDGLLIYNTTTGSLNYYNAGWFEMKGSALEGLVACNAITEGRLEGDVVAANDVKSKIVYAKSNGTPYDALTIQSTGVTGLTASLDAGTFNVNGGELEFTITGTPQGTAGGDAVFAITIGGQSCFHKRVVEEKFVCGSSTVTASYNNLPITYGTKVGPNNTCWLDRNLGATQVYSGSGNVTLSDALSLGGLYQWGRKDDGHQTGVYADNGGSFQWNFGHTFDVTLVSTQPTDLFPINPAPIKPQQGENWFNVSIPNNGLSDFIDELSALWYDPTTQTIGPSNPCPDGWRVPTHTELHSFADGGNEQTFPGFSTGIFNQTTNIEGNFIDYHTSDRPAIPSFLTQNIVGNLRMSAYVGQSSPDPGALISPRPVRCIRHE